MLLAFSILALWIFYTAGGFSKIIKAANMEPEPTPEPIQAPPMQPEPITVEPQPEPEPAQKIDRLKLEKIAGNCLAASGCKFDIWHYCRNKSDIELMDIIARYNLDN